MATLFYDGEVLGRDGSHLCHLLRLAATPLLELNLKEIAKQREPRASNGEPGMVVV